MAAAQARRYLQMNKQGSWKSVKQREAQSATNYDGGCTFEPFHNNDIKI
jgi:hypothetical protein